jgi:hypothetical protein
MSELALSDGAWNEGLAAKKAAWSISPNNKGEAADGEGVLPGMKGEELLAEVYGGVLPGMKGGGVP